MKYALPALLLLLTITACNKNPDQKITPIDNNKALAWVKTYGGTNYDFNNAAVQLSTGEYVVAGSSRSSDGDIPGSRFGYDIWLLKLDAAGNKISSKIFGDNTDEFPIGIVATSDGGVMIAGYSGFLLGANGFVVDSFPNYAWVIKADASGNKVWQKQIPTDSKALTITRAADGNYLVAGYMAVSDRAHDGWIMKIDESGNQLWTKTAGSVGEDQIMSMVPSSDGGFVVSGFTSPSVNRDGWIAKFDAGGNQIWSKTYGGSSRDVFKSIIATTEGGFVAAGETSSSDGDIKLRRGGADEWIMKLDGLGNKIWSQTFGGRNDEIITNVVNTPDGGYLTAGFTTSVDFDVTRPNGDWGAWLIKTDKDGNKTAASTYGDAFDNITHNMINTKDGGYIISGHTDARNSSGINYDGWMIKIDSL